MLFEGTSGVYVPPRTQSVTAATDNINCALAGDLQVTCTSSPTLTPTGSPNNGRQIVVECLASGAQRVVTLASTVALTRDVTTRALTIPSGKVGIFGLRYSALLGSYILLSATITA